MEAVDRAQTRPSDAVAAILSVLIPGAGQVYKGRITAGALWFIFTAAGYLTVLMPGIFLHFLCVFQAYWMPAGER